jgi:hypothetical protein
LEGKKEEGGKNAESSSFLFLFLQPNISLGKRKEKNYGN